MNFSIIDDQNNSNIENGNNEVKTERNALNGEVKLLILSANSVLFVQNK